LHRGIGLLLLVRKWDADPARRDEAAAERTLAKAAAALRTARDERPADPRANLYLADVYERLGQPSAASAARAAARTAGPDAALTPGERDALAAAGR
jgi:cytochrome c-type biogenesis protein CcmH/NrfG